MLISVCVCTHKNPEGLKLLLDGLANLTFSQVSCSDMEVIIVDNDNSDIANKICSEMAPEFPWSLKTEVEAQRGVGSLGGI